MEEKQISKPEMDAEEEETVAAEPETQTETEAETTPSTTEEKAEEKVVERRPIGEATVEFMGTGPFQVFESKDMEERTGRALAAGVIVDFSKFHEDDTDGKQNELIKALNQCKCAARPAMVIDLAPMRELGLLVDGKEWEDPEKDKETKDLSMARLVIPANRIVDVAMVGSPMGQSIMKVNSALPAYRWFQAANLIMQDKNRLTRVIPFPLEQESGELVYQALQVSQDEFRKYQELLVFSVQQCQCPMEGFATASKFAYEILRLRGHEELTYKEVDKTMTHIVIMKDSVMRGVLITNSSGDDFDDIERFSIYI